MALFSRKEDNTKAVDSVKKVKSEQTVVSKSLPTDRDLASVIVKPRITEKAVAMNDSNVYTFIVRRDANKYDVKDAVKELYKVTPVKVNIVNKAPRQYMSRSRGRKISEQGMKKAYVYLKKGDHINLV